jgi:hypothetical protein
MHFFIPRLKDRKHIPRNQSKIPVKEIDMSVKLAPCPETGEMCKRHRFGYRTVRHLGYIVKYKTSTHYSEKANKYFTIPLENAKLGYKYGDDVYNLIEQMHQYSLPDIKWYLEANYNLSIRESSIHDIKQKNIRLRNQEYELLEESPDEFLVLSDDLLDVLSEEGY